MKGQLEEEEEEAETGYKEMLNEGTGVPHETAEH